MSCGVASPTNPVVSLCPNCSRYDLYTKSESVPDIEQLWPYYQTLIDKYLPGELEF